MRLRNLYTTPFVFLLGISLSACSQDTAIVQYPLGSSTISIRTSNFSSPVPIVFVQLHHNETTAATVTQQFSDSLQIAFVQILNSEKRLIDFESTGNAYRFDPNRMFSKEGIAASLILHSQPSDEALTIIDSFGKIILSLLNGNKTIVTVHNNTDEGFTLNDYIHNETGLVHQNSSLDPDDFFITTDSTIYERLKEKDFNVVWEWSEKLTDDGSLSIYCSRNKIHYVNIEAEHGHSKEQAAMLLALIEILK